MSQITTNVKKLSMHWFLIILYTWFHKSSWFMDCSSKRRFAERLFSHIHIYNHANIDTHTHTYTEKKKSFCKLLFRQAVWTTSMPWYQIILSISCHESTQYLRHSFHSLLHVITQLWALFNISMITIATTQNCFVWSRNIKVFMSKPSILHFLHVTCPP